jgi:hypothetical protein
MSGETYDETTRRIVEDAPRLGSDAVRVYDDVWVTAHDFHRVNAHVWAHPGSHREFGWCCWKPLLAIDTWHKVKQGDTILYLDADSYPVANHKMIHEIAERDGAMFFKAQTHNNVHWNKADCLDVMNARAHQFAQHACGRFFAVRVGGWREYQFLHEWLTYSVNLTATTFAPSKLASEHKDFHEHRTEQAILTNLVHRFGYRLWRECDNSGEESAEDRDVMPVALFQQVHQGSCVNGRGSRWRNV